MVINAKSCIRKNMRLSDVEKKEYHPIYFNGDYIPRLRDKCQTPLSPGCWSPSASRVHQPRDVCSSGGIYEIEKATIGGHFPPSFSIVRLFHANKRL